MSGNNRGEAEAQYRNNDTDTHQTRLRSRSERLTGGKEGHEIDVEIRILILIQTDDTHK